MKKNNLAEAIIREIKALFDRARRRRSLRGMLIPGAGFDDIGHYGVVLGRYYVFIELLLYSPVYRVQVNELDVTGLFGLNVECSDYKDRDDAVRKMLDLVVAYGSVLPKYRDRQPEDARQSSPD